MGIATEAKVDEVVDTCQKYGADSIVVLSGVPGTGKSHVAYAAARKVAGHAAFVREVQFHPSYTYEDFVEGLKPRSAGGFAPEDGVFVEWSRQASADSENDYVLLIEELSRAPLTTVLGELMTYLEHRERQFTLPISHDLMRIAPNLILIATMNPRDRSALEVDDALIRRLRIIDCPPDTDQLAEMLTASLSGGAVHAPGKDILDALVNLFVECEARHPDTYTVEMPFGHGMFNGVRDADDLRALWHQRIKHMLRRPLVLPHPFTETITELYPWRD